MQKIKNGPEKKCFDLRSQFFLCELGLTIGRYGLTFLLLSSLFSKKSHPNATYPNPFFSIPDPSVAKFYFKPYFCSYGDVHQSIFQMKTNQLEKECSHELSRDLIKNRNLCSESKTLDNGSNELVLSRRHVSKILERLLLLKFLAC